MDKLFAVFGLAVMSFVLVVSVLAGNRVEEHNRAWVDNAIKAGCKRTSFAGKDAKPVWTCPDGTAYLEPRKY